MHFLVVDTADARGSVALFRDSSIIVLESHDSDEDYSGWLLPAVARILSSASLTLSQLDGYAVCAGPGSFTGLRVGLTTVKAWSEIYGKPIASVSRLEALAHRSFPLTDGAGNRSTVAQPRFVASFLDARRNQVFASLYSLSADRLETAIAEEVIALPAFLADVLARSSTQAVLWVSPDAPMLTSLPEWPALAAMGHTIQAAPPPFAADLGSLAHQKFLRGETTDSLSLDANYVRRSDAELLWKDARSSG